MMSIGISFSSSTVQSFKPSVQLVFTLTAYVANSCFCTPQAEGAEGSLNLLIEWTRGSTLCCSEKQFIGLGETHIVHLKSHDGNGYK